MYSGTEMKGGAPITWTAHTVDTNLPGAEFVDIADLDFDGNNMMPFLEGKSDSPTGEFYFILAQRIQGLRKGPWKLVIKNEGSVRIEHSDFEDVKLYNLDLDPGERYDFSEKEPEIVEELKQQIAEFDLQMINESLKRQSSP